MKKNLSRLRLSFKHKHTEGQIQNISMRWKWANIEHPWRKKSKTSINIVLVFIEQRVKMDQQLMLLMSVEIDSVVVHLVFENQYQNQLHVQQRNDTMEELCLYE